MYSNYMNSPAPMTMSGLYQPTYNSALRQEIVKVHGENGARAYQMAANSSALLLDDTDAIVWLVQTDGAGCKTLSPFTITPYHAAPAIDLQDLKARLEKLEEKFNEPDNSKANVPEL